MPIENQQDNNHLRRLQGKAPIERPGITDPPSTHGNENTYGRALRKRTPSKGTDGSSSEDMQ